MAKFTKTTTEEISVDCPRCAGGQVIKYGRRNGYQRYRCMDCRKAFRYNGDAPGHRVPSEHIGMAIRLFYSGMSYKQIGETMADAFDIPEPSKATLYEWVRDYTDRATAAMQDYPAHTGPEWVADEMMVDVGGEKMWNWNVMDSDTRYVLASHLAKERNAKQAEIVISKALRAAVEPPKSIKTDKLRSYTAAMEMEFPDIKHIQSQGIRAEINNNLSERLQGTYRQRVKTLRGLDSLETGQRYLDGWTLTYNLFREHESLGFDTPGKRARVNAPFTEWEDVVLSRDGLIPPPARDLPELKPQPVIKRLKRRENPDFSDKPAKGTASNGRHSPKRTEPKAPAQCKVAAKPGKERKRVKAPRPIAHRPGPRGKIRRAG